MRANPSPRWLIGRRIVGFDNGADASAPRTDGSPSHDPVIVLDNGAKLRFTAEELDSADGYGICALYVPTPKPGGC